MNEPIELTRAALGEAVNVLAGGTPKPIKPPPHKPTEIPHFLAYKDEWEYGWDGGRWPGKWELAKDPTSNIGTAMLLFLQLRFGTIESYGDYGFRVGWGQATGEGNQGFAFLDFDPFDCNLSDSERLALTICAAFYEWKEGRSVVLVGGEN